MANTSPDNISYPTNADAQKTIEGRIQDTANSVQTALNTKANLSGAVFTGNVQVSASGTLINGSNGTATFVTSSSTKVPLIARGGNDQSANLQEWQNSSAGVVGRVDSEGRLVLPNQPAFSAYASTATLDATRTMPYNVAVVNVGGHYNTSTYRFTAPVAGTYLFSIYDIGFAGYTTRFDLLKNGSSLEDQGKAHQLRANNTSDYATATSFWIVQAAQNDYFEVRIYAGRSHGTVEYSWFQGHLIG